MPDCTAAYILGAVCGGAGMAMLVHWWHTIPAQRTQGPLEPPDRHGMEW